MSDQDFNFNPPPRREVKKAFEPPPWEQEQFEELARRKQAEQEAASGAEEDDAVTAALAAATVKASEEGAEPPEPAAVAGPAAQDGPSARNAVWTGPVPGTDEDPRVEAMLQVLKSEEPQFGRQLWKVSVAAAVLLVSVGLVMTVWGLFAIAATGRAGALGSLGGGILLAFGLGFVGVGGWMAFRTLRQRGVL